MFQNSNVDSTKLIYSFDNGMPIRYRKQTGGYRLSTQFVYSCVHIQETWVDTYDWCRILGCNVCNSPLSKTWHGNGHRWEIYTKYYQFTWLQYIVLWIMATPVLITVINHLSIQSRLAAMEVQFSALPLPGRQSTDFWVKAICRTYSLWVYFVELQPQVFTIG